MSSTPAHTPSRRVLRSVAAAGLSLVLATGLVACGDDDDAATLPATTGDVVGADAPGPPTDGPAYVPNAEPTVSDTVCDAWTAGTGAVHQAPQGPDADLAGHFDTEVLPHSQVLVDELTGDEGADARTIHAALQQMAATGDFAAMEAPEVSDAQARLGEALHVGCDWAAITLQADEYVFEQAPAQLAAGRYSFALENVGVEDHEMVLLRRNDGVTESFEELSAMGEAMMEKVTFTGVAFGGPGTTAYSAVDLEPGTYFLVCFIPVGGEDGPPHFMQGMQETIEVA